MNALVTALRGRAADEVVLEDVAGKMTAGQVLSRIAELQDELARRNIQRLGLLAGNSAAWVLADLACLAGEVCLLPLPDFFSDAQLLHSINTAGLDAILTDDPVRVAAITGSAFDTGQSEQTGGLTLLELDAPTTPQLPRGTQKITFTSGSTGAPRGVCLSSKNQLRVAAALLQSLPFNSPRHLCLLPLSTLLENIGGVYYPLLAGGTIYIPTAAAAPSGGSLDILSMLSNISRHRPTSIILLPQTLVGLVAAVEDGWTVPHELQFMAVGGAKVSAALIRRARQLGLPVYEGYGLSETGSVACINYPGSDRIGSVGRPLPHLALETHDDEVCITGNAFLGYAGQPDTWGENRIMTGDLGTLDSDGFLHLHGRRKNLLISDMGRNISPEWVESELLTHPEIAQCVVFGDARPFCSALILSSVAATTDAELQHIIDEVNSGLPGYARVLRWHRLHNPLSASSGLYTENGRPNRPNIARHYADTIDSLYGGITA